MRWLFAIQSFSRSILSLSNNRSSPLLTIFSLVKSKRETL